MTNYCTKCACYFEKPGTCNCYAPLPWITTYPNPWQTPPTPNVPYIRITGGGCGTSTPLTPACAVLAASRL